MPRFSSTVPPTLALCLCLAGAGCRSPEEYRRDADEEVYALIDARRAALFDEASGFTIDPPRDSLRQRILRGEWDSEHRYSLIEILAIAAENNREVRSRQEQLYRAALDLSLERWRFGWRPGGDGGASLSGGKEAENASADGGLSMTRLLGSGATIVGDIGASLLRVVSTGDGWDLASDLSLSITQPLLAGAGARIVKESLTQAERNLVYEVRSYERFRRTFAVDIAAQVYDLLQAEDEVKNEERNYENLVELRERNEAMAEAGRLSDIQADQALQDELRSEATLLRLRTSLERRRDQFNLLLGLPIDVELLLDPAEFSSLADDDPLLLELDPDRAAEFALGRRLDHLTLLDSVADRERTVLIAEDALRAGLSLNASVTEASAEGRPLDLTSDGLAWSLGLDFTAPLDRKAERNAYRSSLISLAAAQRSAEEDADRIEADVRDALRQAMNASEDLVIQRGALELSERRVESAKLNLDAGRASTRDVLEAQEALVNARNAVTAARITFTLARLGLYLQLELLRVDEDGIHVLEDEAGQLTRKSHDETQT